MANIETARQIALSLPDIEEYVHVGRPAFKRKGKRTFATLWPADNRMTLILSPIDQSVFHSFDPTIFYPIPNKWGLKGATYVELSKVRMDMLGCHYHSLGNRRFKKFQKIKNKAIFVTKPINPSYITCYEP